ncbi:MAG: hypothetical protein AAF433_11300 [Bacteroidota bacterium]
MSPCLPLAFFLLIGCWGTLDAQDILLTDLSPNSDFFRVEQLGQLSVTNLSPETQQGFIRTYLLDRSQEEVVSIRSFRLRLEIGQVLTPNDLNWIQNPQYGRSPLASQLAQSGVLLPGEYVYCAEWVDLSGELVSQNCREKIVGTSLSFSLTYPLDKARITTTQPQLIWEQLTTFSGGVANLNYELRLVEIKPGQSAATAMDRNIPLLQERRLTSNLFLFPANVRPLEMDKHYAWQVSAYYQNYPIISSPIWTFSLVEAEAALKSASSSSNSSYVMLDSRNNRNLYLFSDSIRIAFDNTEGLEELTYSIKNLDSLGVAIQSLPIVNGLEPGLNTIDIATTGIASLTAGVLYQMEVYTPRGQVYYVRFKMPVVN